MQNQWNSIVGIDVSKKTLDVCASANDANADSSSAHFANHLKGYDKLTEWFSDQGIDYTKTLICLENTGIYHRLLVEYLKSNLAFVWVETPVQIKWSLGIHRGKNDAVDAVRIMSYPYRNQDQARDYDTKDKSLQQVSDCLTLRARLKQCVKSLTVPIKELKDVGLVDDAKDLEQACAKSLATMQQEIQALDAKIKKIIKEDQALQENYKLATSVRCVGFVAASYLLVYTHNFTKFDSYKRIASYAGIAPFEYSSGTSVRGRTKVHQMGNKTLKTALHMCALSAIRHNPELKTYFARKVGQGKNKMLVINAVRNKIIARVFSCVQNKREYTDQYAA